jgi:hypothetical protein
MTNVPFENTRCLLLIGSNRSPATQAIESTISLHDYAPCSEDVWGSGDIAKCIFYGGEWATSHPSCFTLGEIASSIQWTGGWESPLICPDAVERRNISSYAGNQTVFLKQYFYTVSKVILTHKSYLIFYTSRLILV